MSFFITSAGLRRRRQSRRARRCRQDLPDARRPPPAPADRTWHAYLSAAAANGQPAVNARDRIGKGPWFNAKGVQVAASVADLHSDAQQAREGEFADREGRRRQRPWRHAEHPRHPDRIERGRHAVEQGRQHLRQLDEEQRRRRVARPRRPSRQAGRRRRAELLELGARHPRAAASRTWWRRAEPGCSTASRSTSRLAG